MSMHPAPDNAAPDWWRLLLVSGGLFLLWRLMRGIGSLFWTSFGLATAFWWSGGMRLFG